MHQLILELWEQNIFCLPIKRINGQITHPNSYHDYRKNVSIDKIPKLDNANGIAVIPGYFGLCCIDFDTKNSKDANLYDNWKLLVDPNILQSCYVEKTRSGGMHVFFKCPGYSEERILAREDTEMVTIEFYCTNRSIIYTFPTPGYSEINTTLYDTGCISKDEAKHLTDTAKTFNKLIKIHNTNSKCKRIEYPDKYKLQFEKYDSDCTSERAAELFYELSGWPYKYNALKKYFAFHRPGATASNIRDAVVFDSTSELVCFTQSQPWFPTPSDYDDANPVPYTITPCNILYAILKDWDSVAIETRQKIPIRVLKYLLGKIEKNYLKTIICFYGRNSIGEGNPIWVDTPMLVFMMYAACPQYRWTTEFSPTRFSLEECKEVYSNGKITGW